jgi:hypothetical protein
MDEPERPKTVIYGPNETTVESVALQRRARKPLVGITFVICCPTVPALLGTPHLAQGVFDLFGRTSTNWRRRERVSTARRRARRSPHGWAAGWLSGREEVVTSMSPRVSPVSRGGATLQRG